MDTKVIWAMSCVYPTGSSVAAHSHEFYHCLYVKSGGGYFKINGRRYEAKSRHIYVFAPLEIHEIHAGEDGLIAYEIKFEENEEIIKKRLSGLPSELFLSGGKAEPIFESIFNEMKNDFAYGDEMLSIKFRELLLVLFRQSENRDGERDSGVYFSEKFAEVLFYMQENLGERISLQELAEIAHLEKIYFLKRFKSEMGQTPMNYLNRLRMAEAKKLLMHSDMNISQIASAVGFPDVHHFSGAFKKFEGMSPSEYKASAKQ